MDFVVHNTGNHKARIWMNSGFDEDPPKYIQFGLQGVVSNSMGVGAWVEVTDNGLTQRRITHCGENYLGQESFYEHFGLGSMDDLTSAVDQIKIEWPSGVVDIWNDFDNQDRHVFIEGTSPCENFDNSPIDLCNNPPNTFYLETNWDGSNVIWTEDSTGNIVSQTNALPTNYPGNYTGTVFHENTELCSVTQEITGISIAADLNGSGTVDSDDFLELLTGYGCQSACEIDINNDGVTDVDDLLQMLVEFGASC